MHIIGSIFLKNLPIGFHNLELDGKGFARAIGYDLRLVRAILPALSAAVNIFALPIPIANSPGPFNSQVTPPGVAETTVRSTCSPTPIFLRALSFGAVAIVCVY